MLARAIISLVKVGSVAAYSMSAAAATVPVDHPKVSESNRRDTICARCDLYEKYFVDTATTDPNGLYQSHKKVGNVGAATFTDGDRSVMFDMVHLSDYPDPTRPLQYRNWLISCQWAQRAHPKPLVRNTVSIMIAGPQPCEVFSRPPPAE